MSETTSTRRTNLPAKLADADRAYQDIETEIEAYGEETVEQVADAYRQATDLLDRYEGQATGTGKENFRNFIQFQEKFATLTEDLPDDLPERDAFEAANDRFDKRRLSESDFEAARETLESAAEIAGLLDERREALEHFREVRREVGHAIGDLREEIAARERLVELGEADLDAPIEDIREPIETYNAAVSDAFSEFKAEASAREVLGFVAATDDYSLIEFREVPENLRDYVETNEVATEPISDLLEYAGYSNSKLDHYVENPAALKRAVATNQTYLERLDAGPLQLDWPPKSAVDLRWRVEELISVVARFAPDEVVADLRAVQSLVRDEAEFERLRTAAEAKTELSDSEREKVASGEVESELAELRAEKERLEDAREEYPER